MVISMETATGGGGGGGIHGIKEPIYSRHVFRSFWYYCVVFDLQTKEASVLRTGPVSVPD